MDAVCLCRDEMRKAKAQPELNMAKVTEQNKKVSEVMLAGKGKSKEAYSL